jgi:hypothetical protein
LGTVTEISWEKKERGNRAGKGKQKTNKQEHGTRSRVVTNRDCSSVVFLGHGNNCFCPPLAR